MALAGSISANNFIQLPHPTALLKSLGLTGRYVYIELKSPAGAPFSIHLDFAVADRGHGVRVSLSNLFKQLTSSGGMVVQVPIDLRPNRWSVVMLDVTALL